MTKYLLGVALFFSSCYSTPTPTSSKTEITGLKRLAMYVKSEMEKHKDSLDTYQPPVYKMEVFTDSFILDKTAEYGFVRVSNPNTPNRSLTRYKTYKLTQRDSAVHLPNKILDFVLQGVYMNIEDRDADDVMRHCVYLHPQTKDVITVAHMFYIGNPFALTLFTHDDTIDPFKGKEAVLKEVMRLGKPLQTSQDINFNLRFKGSNIDSVSVNEH